MESYGAFTTFCTRKWISFKHLVLSHIQFDTLSSLFRSETSLEKEEHIHKYKRCAIFIKSQSIVPSTYSIFSQYTVTYATQNSSWPLLHPAAQTAALRI